jgi:hypothetical protein
MTLIDSYIQLIRQIASQIPDKRTGKNIRYSMIDIVIAAFSVFFFQCSSWLEFQRQLDSHELRSNLQSIFQCKNIPTDNHVRMMLDGIDPKLFTPIYNKVITDFISTEASKYYIVLDKYNLIAIDGTEIFNSKKIMCENCFKRYHKKEDTTDFVHIAVGAAICSPKINEVLCFPPEFVTPQENSSNGKQDTECKAASRMLPELRDKTTNMNVILLLDAIYGNQPMIKDIINNNFDFIITAKEGSQKNIFDYVDGANLDEIKTIVKVNGKQYHRIYRYMNDIPLINQRNSIKINYIELIETEILTNEQIYKLNNKASIRSKNKTYKDYIKSSKFSYITSLTPNEFNIAELCECGRTRWRIENGFNSLKNRGYNFDHNFGHGKKTLSSVLATLMILAYLINSVSAINDELFIKVRKKCSSFKIFIHDMCVLTKYMIFNSLEELLLFMYEKLYREKYSNSS